MTRQQAQAVLLFRRALLSYDEWYAINGTAYHYKLTSHDPRADYEEYVDETIALCQKTLNELFGKKKR